MRNITSALVLILSVLTLSACKLETPGGYDSHVPASYDGGTIPEWTPADCAREHRVQTIYRNTRGRVTYRVTETFFFEDLPGDPTDSLVRTCTVYPDNEIGCATNLATNNYCLGDVDGPWPLCEVGYASTDGEGLAIAACGSVQLRESFDDDGSVVASETTQNTVEVHVRPN